MRKFTGAFLILLSLASVAAAQQKNRRPVELSVQHVRPFMVVHKLRQELRWHSAATRYTESDWSVLLPGIDFILPVDHDKILLVRGTEDGLARLRKKVAILDAPPQPSPAIRLKIKAEVSWRNNLFAKNKPIIRYSSPTEEAALSSNESTGLRLESVLTISSYSGPGLPQSYVEVMPHRQSNGSISLLCVLHVRDPEKPSVRHPNGEFCPDVVWERRDHVQPGTTSRFVLSSPCGVVERVVLDVTLP